MTNQDFESQFLDLLEADQTDPDVQYGLGLCYLRGQGTGQNGAEAEKWLRRAAEQGHEEARALLDSCCSSSAAPQAITEDTLPDWCAAAEDGDPEAQYRVALYFQDSHIPGTEDDVARYLAMAVAQGHPQACLLLGRQKLETDPEAAIHHLRNAADCGVAEAMELLGECYAKGHGVPQDLAQAEHWFSVMAQHGDGEAMLSLARRYKLGNGVPRSLGRALSWLKRAQLAGAADAQERYYAEERAQQAAQEAEERARQAAREAEEQARQAAREAEERARQAAREAEEQARLEAEAAFASLLEQAQAGDADAQNSVGCRLADGDGCSQDPEQAAMWYEKAARQGNVLAQYNLA